MNTRPAILQCEHPSHYDRDTHEIALTARYCPGTEEGHEGAKVIDLYDVIDTLADATGALTELEGPWADQATSFIHHADRILRGDA